MGNRPFERIRVPLSLVQEHMWWLERYAPSAGFFNEWARCRFQFALDPGVLEGTLAFMIRRHESLRTTFPAGSGEPYQSIAPSAPIHLSVCDLSALTGDEQRRELLRLESAAINETFDSATGPLFGGHLFVLGDRVSEGFFVFDHLVSDPTSEAIFVSELEEAYCALAAGESPRFGSLEIQYADFSVWQRRWMTEARLLEYHQYWRVALARAAPGRMIPYCGDVWDPALQTRIEVQQPARLAFTVPTEVTDALRRTSRSPVFAICTAAVAAILARSTGERDAVLVTSVGGRDRSELDGIIGLFANVCVLYLDLSDDPSFDVVLRRARASLWGALEHQHVPFYQVEQALRQEGVEFSLGGIPVALHFFHAAHRRWVPGTSVLAGPPLADGWVEPDLPESSKPLEFRFYDDGTTLWCDLLYHRQFYDEDTVIGAVADLKALLGAVAREPFLRLSQLPGPSSAAPAKAEAGQLGL